jgi:hypothetical protein
MMRALPSSKPCQLCKKLFYRPTQCTDKRWGERLFCSHACARAARLSARPDIETVFESRIEKTDGCWLWRGVVRYGFETPGCACSGGQG